MDSDRLLELAQAVEESRQLEGQLLTATPAEARDLRRNIVRMRKAVTVLQRQLLTNYNESFVACRDVGHLWTLTSREMDGDMLKRALTCNRCGTERRESIDRFGDLDRRQYVHSSEYLIPMSVQGSDVRFTKAFWRGISYMTATREVETA